MQSVCGHRVESVVRSRTALEDIASLRRRDRLAICTTRDREGITSIAVSDGVATLWLSGFPYSLRGLLQSDAEKITFNEDVDCRNRTDLYDHMKENEENRENGENGENGGAAAAQIYTVEDAAALVCGYDVYESDCLGCRAHLLYRVAHAVLPLEIARSRDRVGAEGTRN